MTGASDTEANLSEHKDYYASHLAQVNDNSNQVLASNDIYNDQGILLLRKGAQLDNKSSSQIAKHKLLKPLEHNIELENSLSGKVLLEHFHALLEKYPDIKTIHESHEFESIIVEFFLDKQLNPILTQKLTIMAEQLPFQLEKGLFCAWLSALMAHHMSTDPHDVYEAFVAGLIHDIGMIHLDPDIILADRELSEAEHLIVQSHVIIGQVILSDIPGLPKEICRAVLEHHERCDGTGSPHGKTDEKLSVLGNILAAVDAMYTLRVNQYAKEGRHMGDAILFFRLNETTYSYDVYRSMCIIISKANLSYTELNPHNSVNAYAVHLKKQCEPVSLLMPNMMLLLSHLMDIEKYASCSYLTTTISLTSRVTSMLKKSGFLFDEQIQWLDEVIQEPVNEALIELNDIDFMLQETCRQLKDNYRFLCLLRDNEKDLDANDSKYIKEAVDYLDECFTELTKSAG